MKLHLYPEVQSRLAAFSLRLQHLAASTDSESYIDPKVQAENLQYSLSFTLARLISVLTFIDRSKNVVEALLHEFNQRQGTALTYGDFESIGWLRCINNDVLIPSSVKYFIWQVGYYEQEEKPVEIPQDKAIHVAFLRLFYERCYQDAKLTISPDDLAALLAPPTHSAITIRFLVERKVLVEKNGSFCWLGGDYVRQLGNEIAASLWLLTTDKKVTEKQFRRYVKQLHGAQVWPNDMRQFLSPAATTRISNLATAVLLQEPDLVNTDTEFRKIWLDSPSYAHIKITDEVPHVSIAGQTSAALIEHIEQHKWRFRDVFDHQASRGFHDLLLRLALSYDSLRPSPYPNTIQLLEAVDRPYIVWKTFEALGQRTPQAIPYLLNDSELAPLAFKALTKLGLSQFWVSEQENRDERYRQQQEVLGDLWLELFGSYLDIAVTATHAFDELGKSVGGILYQLAIKAFATTGSYSNGHIEQQAAATVYPKALAALGDRRIGGSRYFMGDEVPAKLIDELFSGISTSLRTFVKLVHLEYIRVDLAAVDLSIKLLQLVTHQQKSKQQAAGPPAVIELIHHLRKLLDDYYTTAEVTVEQYVVTGPVTKTAKKSIDYFGAELVEWGYLFCQFSRLDLLDELATTFLDSLQINRTAKEGKYDDANQREADKLRFFLKTLLLAYLDIHPRQSRLELEGLPVNETLTWLESTIEQIATQYSQDDLAAGRIDLFEESLSLGHDAHWVSLTALLYRCLNLFKSESRRQFLERFFDQSLELGRMLAAINLLDSQELREAVAEKIDQTNLDDFIKSKHTVTDLEETLIEAINSSTHWQAFAEPLLQRVQRHFKDRGYRNERQNLLFEIELLLLYKRKDGDHLKGIAIPTLPEHLSRQKDQLGRLKEFFLSLHLLYNEHQFDNAIPMLERLLAYEPSNIRYAFQLYRARTLQAISSTPITTAGRSLLQRAQQDWETFVGKLSEEQKKINAGWLEAVDSNSIHYLAYLGTPERFDQTVSRLSNGYLFSEELVPVIYTNYKGRGLYELAYNFLDKATQYYSDNQEEVPATIDKLRNGAGDYRTVERLKQLLGSLVNQGADLIPKILPDRLNGQRNIDEFILHEFIQAARVMVEKIEGVRQITGENQYNDLLMALIQLRFAVWGWSVHDQPRVGRSEVGSDAGEADLVIKSAGNTIALIEALNLMDTKYTKTHVLKCNFYVNISRYYIVVYHAGKRKNLDNAWKKYQQYVTDMAYPDEFALDSSRGFENLPTNLASDDFIKVGKTHLGASYTMFHLMIALGNNG